MFSVGERVDSVFIFIWSHSPLDGEWVGGRWKLDHSLMKLLHWSRRERPLLYSGDKGDRETWADLRSILKTELNGPVEGWGDGDIKKLSKKAVVCQTGEAWKGKT